MLRTCPDPQDVQDLQFKLQCRLKVFDNTDLSTFPTPHNLVSCASRYGLVFVGTSSNSIQVIQTKQFHNYSPKDKDVPNYPRRTIEIPSSAKHLCVNCDSTVLAVVIEKNQCPVVIFYDVLSFLSKNIKALKEIRLSSTPNVFVKEVNWNPAIPGIFTACKSDGSLGVYELKGDLTDLNELPSAAGVTSFCWSPKGKQIAVGSKDGKITQYKPDLKPVKAINAPPLPGSNALICLQWVSNFQFIGVYQSSGSESSACVILVDAPKTGETVYTNYEDVCYSGSSRMPQFYFIMQQTWNFLMVASANSTEVGVLGAEGDKWTQWIILDAARAELPLGSNHQETFPVGFGFDYSSIVPLPWGESQIPPCPTLLVLSHQGVLCVFNVVYLKKDLPTVCTPPDNVADVSGLSSFTQMVQSSQTPPQSAPTTVTPVKPIQSGQTPMFGGTLGTPTAIQQPLFSSQPVTKPLFGSQLLQEQKPSSSLFGGQITLTPTKPGSSIFGGQAPITPIPKTVGLSSSVSKTEEKYSKIFTALQTTAASTEPNQSTVVIKTEAKLPKTDQTLASTTEPSASKADTTVVDPKLRAETNAIVTQMIQDECCYLESELKAIIHQTKLLNMNVGNDHEKTLMVSELNTMDEFLKEVVDITSGQNTEIHCLKQNLIQAWALYEEATSHYNASKDETLNLLLKAQPLDSLADKRLIDIKQMIYYVDSQLSQANKALDGQWDSFQDYAKKVYKVKMPTMETIFQTMVRQNAVLQRQTYLLKDISMRLKKKSNATNLSLLRLNHKHKDLINDLSRLHLNSQDILQLQYDKVLSQLNSLTETKTQKLRNLVKKKPVAHVTAIKPNLSSWTINQSPSKTRQMISLLGAQMSPVSKPSVARTLDFVQSTPMKLETKISPTNLSAPLAFKKDNITFTANQNTFVGLGSKPGSAFVPTSQKSSGFVAISSSQPTAAGSATFTFVSGQKPNFSVQQPKIGQAGSFGTSNVPNLQAPVIVIDPFKKSEAKLEATKALTSTAASNFTFSFGSTNTQSAAPVTTGQSLSNSTPSLFGSLTAGTAKPLHSAASRSSAASSVLKSQAPKVAPIPTQTAAADLSKSSSTKSVLNLSSTTTSTTVESKPNPLSFSGNLVKPLFSAPVNTDAKTPTSQTPQTSSASASTSLALGERPTSSSITNALQTGNTSIFGSSTSSGSLFGMPNDGTANTKAQSLFGASTVSSSTSQASTEAAVSSSKPSVAVAPVPTSASVFATASSSPSSEASKPLFGVPPTTTANIFATAATSSSTTNNSNIFGGNIAVTSSSNIFGTPKTITVAGSTEATGNTTPTTTAGFGASSTTTGIFATPISSSISAVPSDKSATVFGNTSNVKTTQSNIFGASAAPSATQSGLFGASSTSGSSIFGGSSAATSTSSLFGGQPAVASSASSIFGTTSNVPAFGSAATTSIFGAPPSTTATPSTASVDFGTPSSSSIFGAAAATTATTPTTSTIFGGGATPTGTSVFGAPSGSIFGGTQAQKPTGSIFGQAATFGSAFSTATTSPSVFGAAAATTSQSGFGTATTTQSVFGTPTTTQSVFGGSAASSGSSSSVFSTPASTSASVFGGGTSAGSTFGFGTTPPTTSAFGSSVPTTQPAAQPSFGFGSLSVGSAATSGDNIFGGGSTFGQQSPASNPFGKSTFSGTTGGSNLFGTPSSPASSSGTNIFGTPASSAPAFGGSTGSTFGTSAFGSSSTFGPSPAFGQKPASFGQRTFGNTSFGTPTQGGAFSGGGTPVAQSGFGSPPAFQKPASGFGSPPVFGGSPTPAFGSAPAFGGAPAFGSAPVFGNPNKVFGQAATQAPGTFGATVGTQQSAGFGNLATQNTIGFGNLAQQASGQQFTPFSGSGANPSFSSWR